VRLVSFMSPTRITSTPSVRPIPRSPGSPSDVTLSAQYWTGTLRTAPPVGTARLPQGAQAHLTDALHPHLTYLLEELW
jgi:hypothetical protein